MRHTRADQTSLRGNPIGQRLLHGHLVVSRWISFIIRLQLGVLQLVIILVSIFIISSISIIVIGRQKFTLGKICGKLKLNDRFN